MRVVVRGLDIVCYASRLRRWELTNKLREFSIPNDELTGSYSTAEGFEEVSTNRYWKSPYILRFADGRQGKQSVPDGTALFR
jgi:hypothetical protein